MCDEWMPRLELPLTLEQFHQLPRNPAYKYEYFGGAAWLNPRPRYYHALLDLETYVAGPPPPTTLPVAVRPIQPADWEDLVPVFSAAFRAQQPFGSLETDVRLQATRKSLEHTRSGGDGPWIEAASFVATAPEEVTSVGAILLTLLPDTDPTQWDSFHWKEPPPPDCIERRLGRPHLTWIFVSPSHAGHGTGTVLLRTVAAKLLDLGYKQLASTFMLGNDSSMLWHWRAGFRLLAHPGSARLR
jgi:GNAT superfamily N-acetyltransferase